MFKLINNFLEWLFESELSLYVDEIKFRDEKKIVFIIAREISKRFGRKDIITIRNFKGIKIVTHYYDWYNENNMIENKYDNRLQGYINLNDKGILQDYFVKKIIK